MPVTRRTLLAMLPAAALAAGAKQSKPDPGKSVHQTGNPKADREARRAERLRGRTRGNTKKVRDDDRKERLSQ